MDDIGKYGPWGLVAFVFVSLAKEAVRGVLALIKFLKARYERDAAEDGAADRAADRANRAGQAELTAKNIFEQQMLKELVEAAIRQTALIERVVDSHDEMRASIVRISSALDRLVSAQENSRKNSRIN